jgi:glycosyltransferase involved in cell wall biosynthesis
MEHHFFLWQAWSKLRRMGVDAVHSWFFTDGLAADWAAHPPQRHRTVLQINGVPVPGVSCYNRFPPEAQVYRRAAQRADCRIACSRFIAGQILEAYGVDAEVIPPPVNLQRYTLGPGPTADSPPRVIAAGDFTVRRKGLRVLLEAFRLLRARRPEVTLQIAGKHPELPPAEGLTFRGSLSSEDLVRLYQHSSCLVLPSMWEPSGTVLIEALACGTPVVATRHAGIPEFANADTGVLFDPLTNGEETTNADGLAEAMERGLELSRAPGIRERCHHFASRFSFEALGPKIEAVYGARQ